MNIEEMKKKLQALEVPDYMYTLTLKLPSDQFYIGKISDKNEWEVYYGERGRKNDRKVFDDESKACEDFIEWIVKYK